MRRALPFLIGLLAASSCLSSAARADDTLSFPVLVPLTGFLSLEGTSQRNGAVLALKQTPAGVAIASEVVDTGTSPEAAVTALERAAGRGTVGAVAASMATPGSSASSPATP